MALEKQTFVEQINIARDGRIYVRAVRAILEDGVEESRRQRSLNLAPGDDIDAAFAIIADDNQVGKGFKVPNLEVRRVKDVAKAIWTTEVIAAFKAAVVVPNANGS